MSRTAMDSSSSSRSLEEEAERLRGIRSDIRRHLEEAEKKRVKTESDKLRLKSLWKIFYDAEDALDDYHDWKKTGIDPPGTGCCKKRKRPGSTAEQSICRDPCSLFVEANISKVLEDFGKLAKITSSLVIYSGHLWRTKDEAEEPTGYISGERNIYRFQDDAGFISEVLTRPSLCWEYINDDCMDSENAKLIISYVIGSGGIGKTTLAQCVYKLIAAPFEMKAWISCVPREDKLCALNLLNSLLQCIDSGGRGNFSQLAQVQECLMRKLKNKRLFFVLDDARSIDQNLWEMFWPPILNAVAEGSVAMVTVRNTNVIEAMPKYLPKLQYNLRPLKFEDCWLLFKSSTGSPEELEDGNDNELAIIGKQIVNKYEGFPKAIKAIAGKLRSSRDPGEWRQHLDMAARDYFSFWMTSYCELQPGSKRCLLYCTLFPEGHTFEKDYLMKLWKAEGFVTGDTSSYLTELIRRFFLEEVDNEGGRLAYKVATFAHGFLNNAEVTVTSIFRQTNDNNIEGLSFSEECHISFTGQTKEAHLQPENPKDLQHLRSLLVIHSSDNRAYTNVSSLNFPKNFLHMGHLRILELSYTDIKTLPDSIIYLRNLRFLGLNGTEIETLPDTVCKLDKLQALELKFCWKLRELPKFIGDLVSLERLNLDSDTKLLCMPRGLGKLTKLESLPIFKLGEKSDEQSGLEELGELKNLKNELCILGLSHISIKDLKIRCLEKKEHLKTLKLCWSSSRLVRSSSKHSRSYDTSVLKPHTNLKHLTIQSYNGNELPNWISCTSFKKLEVINLNECLNCDSLPPLGQLPLLKRLVINCPEVKKIDAQFCGNGSGSFPSLEELTFIEMWNLQEWTVKNVNNFPKLEMLKFENCPIFERIPEFTSTSLVSESFMRCKGPINLGDQPNLKHLWVEECGELHLDDKFIQNLKELDSLLVANCDHDIPNDFEVGHHSFFKDEHALFKKKDEHAFTISFDKTQGEF